MLKFLLSRNGHTVSNEINHYFSGFDALEKAVSKQAVFQAKKKLDYHFFAFINAQLCRHYYKNNKYKTWRGYSVIAVDGSIGEAPYTNECFCMFGADIPNKKFNQAKTSPRISGFYDVLNELYIDVSITSFSNCFIRILWK